MDKDRLPWNRGQYHFPWQLDASEDDQDSTISIIAPRAFILLWLLPRLPRFAQIEPQINIALATIAPSVPKQTIVIDCVPAARAHDAAPLMDEAIVPVCTPALRGCVDSDHVALSYLPLLHDLPEEKASCFPDWSRYCSAFGIDRNPAFGQRFARTHLAVEAAGQGSGLLLARSRLVADAIAEGRLLQLGQAYPDRYRYTLQPGRTARSQDQSRFLAWLQHEAAQPMHPLNE